ncbi:MAG: ABC transporter permease [Bryobacteraceae bacterium]|nr:ABC transporter permease [Bryobacteraceae bacterium]
MTTLAQDLRYSLRTLRRAPGFTVTALLTLALGIGATTAIFTVVDAVLLRDLPFPNAERLAFVWASNPQVADKVGGIDLPTNPGDFTSYRRQTRTFERMAQIQASQSTLLSQSGEPEKAGGAYTTGEFFDIFGLRPAIGRFYTAADDTPAGKHVVVISNRLWQRRFGGDPGVLGQALKIDNTLYTVIGVAPPGFSFPTVEDLHPAYGFSRHSDLWLPMGRSAAEAESNDNRGFAILGLLKPGVTPTQADAEMSGFARVRQKQFPESNAAWDAAVIPMLRQVTSRSRTAMLILLGAVAFVLLIACANVANLLLARAAVRRKEFTLRTALGAGRGRVVRQLLTESALLAVVAGGIGVAVAWAAVRWLVVSAPSGIPRLQEVSIHWGVLGFALVVSLLSGFLFGLLPALQASRLDLNEVLKESGRSLAGSGSHARGALIIGEVALAVMLLAGAGLLIRSLANLTAIDPGFDLQSVVTMSVSLDHRYQKRDDIIGYQRRLLDRIRALPGVESAALSSEIPLSGQENLNYAIADGKPEPPPGQAPFADDRRVSPEYFRTMGIELIEGRSISDQDVRGKTPVVVVNRRLAETLFPGENPIGHKIRNDTDPKGTRFEIVGVVENVRQSTLEIGDRLQLYRSSWQSTGSSFGVSVRVKGDSASIAQQVRRAMREIDPEQFISDPRTMAQMAASSLDRRRFQTVLMASFALLALVLTVIGLYGVISYTVNQRTREFGVRMALGASGGNILRQVVSRGLALAGLGAAIGLGGALATVRWMRSLLFGVTPFDPLTIAGVCALLLATALAACYLPARRATKLDPMTALRYE